MLRSIRKSISSVYLLYELNTCIYMLDPWEKKFANGVIFAILALLVFSSYAYLPNYTRKLVSAFLPAHQLTEIEMEHQHTVNYNVH